MALSVVRKGVASLTGRAGRSLLTPVTVVRPQVSTIVSKAFRDKDYKRAPPFPYKKKPYGLWASAFDKTTWRFDENTRIIVVDGPIAAGKTKFAKEIAEELDMLYVPEATMDMVYINSYGYDLRQLNPQLPDAVKTFDEKDFVRNPTHPNVGIFQFEMFSIRLSQYIDALAHLLNTGQGVVMDRSVYSEIVFVDTLVHCGFMSKQARKLYYQCRKEVIPHLMRPHLLVYLDTPVDIVLQNIKARNLPHEANSPLYTHEFLSHMEIVYKQFLKEISVYSQVLVYDWSDEGDAEVVVEDIETVNFNFTKYDPKMKDWKIEQEYEWCERRMSYTIQKDKFMFWSMLPNFTVKELMISPEDQKIFRDVWWNGPGQLYAEGFNADMGDTGILTKMKYERR